LLFREGDPFSERLLAESARILRDNEYLYTASVEPLAWDPETGVVDVAVRTRDIWTLMPGASVSRSGGENELHVSLSEKNLLGRGRPVRHARRQHRRARGRAPVLRPRRTLVGRDQPARRRAGGSPLRPRRGSRGVPSRFRVLHRFRRLVRRPPGRPGAALDRR